MKVILNQDVKHLGEEGDVKVVANGYARNYLFPRNFALPFNDVTVAYFESRKEEIEKRKEQKRRDSASLKEKIEALTAEISMPAGTNGKLFGAVTSQTISDYLNKSGIEIERKRIEIVGVTIKVIGKYVARIHLYESEVAELKIIVSAQEDKTATAKNASTKKVEKAPEAKVEAPETTADTTAEVKEETISQETEKAE